MPRHYKKKYKRKPRRRRYARLRSMGAPSGVPTKRRVSMRYAQLISITSTAGVIGNHVFRANSLFDPDYTTTGHQPISFDIMSQLYNQYCVVGSKISASFVENSAGNSAPAVCGIYLDDSTTAPYTSANSYIEARKGTYKTIQGSSRHPTTVYSKFSAKKFFNIVDPKDNQDTIGALMTTNPTETANFIVWFATLDGTSNATDIMITMDFIVDFTEPKAPVES